MHAKSVTHYVASCYIAILTMVSRAFSWVLILLVRSYQVVLGAMLGGHCRFQPTCSTYALDAIRNCGPLKGLRLAIWRILRCHPFSKGGYDPAPEPPEKGEKGARHPFV
jgi:uncharacterized protein